MNNKKILIPIYIVVVIGFIKYVLPMAWWGMMLLVDASLGKPTIYYEDRSSSLLGVDENKNGVRDDIERYLEESLGEYSYNVRMANLELVKADLALLTVDLEDMDKLKEVNQNIQYRTYCSSLFSESRDKSERGKLREISSTLGYLVVNTSKRKDRYKQAYKPNLNGSIMSTYYSSHLHEICGYKVSNPYRALAKSYYYGNLDIRGVELLTDLMMQKYPNDFNKENKNEVIKEFLSIINNQ